MTVEFYSMIFDLVKCYLMEDTNLLLLWECWFEGPGPEIITRNTCVRLAEKKKYNTTIIQNIKANSLLKPSYSSSLTGEIPRPSYWWLLDDVSDDGLASVAGWLLIGMLTPVIPVRGLCECLVWPREYSPPCGIWVPMGVDMRLCGASVCCKRNKIANRIVILPVSVCFSSVTVHVRV